MNRRPAAKPADLRPVDVQGKPINRRLDDDLADVLAATFGGWDAVIAPDFDAPDDVRRVMARYRAERLT